tara:strand:- start:60 stop:287 length:228 start_codon:yes stop_codon:yes gene_type:complete
MKVTVTEIRETRFIHNPSINAVNHYIHTEYEVYIKGGDLGGTIKTFYSKEHAETYIEHIKEKKNDYSKVIKEIEI